MDLDRFNKLRREIEDLERQKARAEGALEGLIDDLENEFGVSSLESAEEQLEAMESDLEHKEAKLESYLNEFEKDFGDKLDA